MFFSKKKKKTTSRKIAVINKLFPFHVSEYSTLSTTKLEKYPIAYLNHRTRYMMVNRVLKV